MGAQKQRRSAKHEDKLTAKYVKLKKTGKHGGLDRIGKARKADKKKHTIFDAAVESETLYVEQHVDEPFKGQVVVKTEPTVYDSLLKKLGSRNNNVADAVRRRQREEQGKIDTDGEDKDSDLESIDELEETDDDDDGNNDDDGGDMSPRNS